MSTIEYLGFAFIVIFAIVTLAAIMTVIQGLIGENRKRICKNCKWLETKESCKNINSLYWSVKPRNEGKGCEQWRKKE